MDTPTTFDFESLRTGPGDSFKNVGAATHVLTAYKSRSVVGALDLKARTISTSHLDLLADQPTLYWTSHSLEPFIPSEYAYPVEVIRTFSYDQHETEVEWLVLISAIPSVFSKFFKATTPFLLKKTFQGRFAIADTSGNVLITAHDVWRDTDGGRGVVKQYLVRDRDHPLWIQALWSAFSINPG